MRLVSATKHYSTDEEQTLLKLAIEASSRAYQENVDNAADYQWISKHESRGKPIVIKEYVNHHTLVVGIKGTLMMEDCGLKSRIHDGPHMLADWGLNFNNEPLLASQVSETRRTLCPVLTEVDSYMTVKYNAIGGSWKWHKKWKSG